MISPVEEQLIPKPTGFAAAGLKLGELLAKKNQAYGNSFEKCEAFLRILYPQGVPVEAYQNVMTLSRMFDKMMRIATDQDAFGEDPYNDIAGYAILMSEQRRKVKAEQFKNHHPVGDDSYHMSCGWVECVCDCVTCKLKRGKP